MAGGPTAGTGFAELGFPELLESFKTLASDDSPS